MIDIIVINILKIINKLVTTNIISNKINSFYLNVAHQTLNKLKKAKKKNFSAKQIKTTLFFSGIRLKVKNDEFYQNFLDLITDSGDIKKNQIYLKNFIQSKNFDSVGFRTWLRLRDIFYLKLEMVLGGICRQKAIEFVTKGKFEFFLTRKDRARARLETTLNNSNIKDYLKQFPLEYNFNKQTLDKFFQSIHNIKPDITSHEIDNKSEKFLKILNNKSVAIVGPAETTFNNASEIDSFDIVVRLNYTSSGKNLDEFKKGLKTDISYFNGEQINSLIQSNNSKLPNELKIACIKDNATNRKEHLEKANPDKIIKKINNYNMLNFYSSFNLLPLILLDILEANAKMIKVFHCDLFLTPKRVDGYYKKIDNKDFSKTFLDHDPMMNHKFLKKIYKLNKIKGDTKFDEVMKLDTDEYLNKLEYIYH